MKRHRPLQVAARSHALQRPQTRATRQAQQSRPVLPEVQTPYLTTAEAAVYTRSCSVNAFRHWARRAGLASRKSGRLWDRRDIDAKLAGFDSYVEFRRVQDSQARLQHRAERRSA